MDEHIIFAGTGGQGVLTLGKLVCIMMMHEGKYVTYVPSYGTEVRGGTCNCNVRVSDRPIYSPRVEQATSMIAMNAPSYERFRGLHAPDGIVVVNSSLAKVHEGDEAFTVPVPASEIADELGNIRVANVVMLGALVACRPLAPIQTIQLEMKNMLGKKLAHLLDVNLAALDRGRRAAAESPACRQG